MANDPEYERWNTRFAHQDYVFGTAVNAFLASQAARLKRGQKALALADGEGRNGVWLAEQGLDVLSVDFLPAAPGKAKKRAARRQGALRTERADLTQRQWETGAYDIVAAIMIQFARSPERESIFRGMKQ